MNDALRGVFHLRSEAERGALCVGTRTPERAPRQQSRVRGGAQTNPGDGEDLVERERPVSFHTLLCAILTVMFNPREVTPLSRILALILFVGIIPALFFYLGTQYQEVKGTADLVRTYDFPRLHVFGGIGVESDLATSTPEPSPDLAQ